MASYIVKIGKGSSIAARPLNIFSDPDAAPFRGNAFLPAAVIVPLKQHCEDAARAALLPGTRVREGQVIGLPSRQNSTYVYASIPGILRGYYTVPLADGSEGNAALIELSGAFELSGRRPAPRSLDEADSDELLSMIEDYGLVRSFEGSFVPLAPLIRKFKESEISANGAILALRLFDYDPSCRADSFLAKTCADAVLEGAALVAKIIGAKRVFLVFSSKKELSASERSASSHFEGLEVKCAASPAVYPASPELFCKRAAALAFGESGAENSVFCINPWTAFIVFNALKYAMPVLQRPVLVAGAAIKAPQMLNVRIGTRIRDIAAQCGGFKFPPTKVIAGGLIAGKAVRDLDAPIDVNTSALHFLGGGEPRFYTAQRCIHCGKCLRTCPCRLDPSSLALILQEAQEDAAFRESGEASLAALDAAKCIFCGACSASCPAGIPLHHIIKGTISCEGGKS